MSTPSSALPPPTPPAPAAPPGRPRRLWRVVLVISLALNVMVAGVVIGGAIRAIGPGGGTGATPGSAMPVDMRGLWRALPSESRAALRAEVRSHMQGERAGRAEAARRDGAAILAVIEAEPFDAQALVAEIEAQRQRHDGDRTLATRAFAEQVAALSAAQRRQMAQDLRHLWRRHLGEGRGER